MWVLLILIAATSLAVVVYRQRKKRHQRSRTLRFQSLPQPISSTTHTSSTRSLTQSSPLPKSPRLSTSTRPSPAPISPQTTSQPVPTPPQITSQRSSDYTKLHNFLAAKQWKEADDETSRLLLKIAGKEKEEWLDPESIASLPCAALQMIDQLWMEYSEGLFGFTVQKKIWMQCGGEVNYDIECRVGKRVGWYGDNGWIDTYLQGSPIFSLEAPSGHLPILLAAKRPGILLRWMGGTEVTHSALAWRFSACVSPDSKGKQKPITIPQEIDARLVQTGETFAIEIPSPISLEEYYHGASILVEQGRYEEALLAYNILLRGYPHLAEVHQGKALSLFHLQRVDEASQACDIALQLNPDFVEANHLKAGILCFQGRLQEALEFCDAVDRLNPQFSPNLPLRQHILDELKQIELGDTSTSKPRLISSLERFLLDTLERIGDGRGNSEEIYSWWAEHQNMFNEQLLESFPEIAQWLLTENATQQVYLAEVFVVFGYLITDFPLGVRSLNLELAIAAFQQALTVITQTTMPERWATIMTCLAGTYCQRIRGDEVKNIEQAIDTYQQALIVRTQTAMPVEWADTMAGLAIAYATRIQGDKAENIERAIDAYQQSLTVRTQTTMPQEWANTISNLARTYIDRIRGDRAENIERAIEACQKALTVKTQEAMPREWAWIMVNLAVAYIERIDGDRAENIEQAIEACEQALSVVTRETMPREWARTMHELAIAYILRIRGNRAENIEQTISACQQALTVKTLEGRREWAMTMMELATAYRERISGNRAENIEQAIVAYHQILQVNTRETIPTEWADTMHNLGNAYIERLLGSQLENIELAIQSYQQVLTIRTREAFPVGWAEITGSLANAYHKRIQGERAENLERAIAAYQSTLEIYQPELFPDKCRSASHYLGALYSEQKRWQEAVLIYQKALQAAEILYQSAILLDSKTAELARTADLPHRAAYALARTDDFQAAVLVIEQGRARGLSEILERDQSDFSQLRQTHPALVTQYQEITAQLRDLEAQQRDRSISDQRHSLTPTDLRNTAIALQERLNETLTQIRQVPGYEAFLHPPTFEDIQQAVTRDRPLVYLVTTPAGSMALTLTVDTIDCLWLDDLTEPQLIELLQIWLTAASHSQTDVWLDAIANTTRQLWDVLVGPLVQKLQDRGIAYITLIPTGYLSLLPLHAAWTEDFSTPTNRRYALDDIHFTYAPNAQSLIPAQAISDRVQADSILAIENPRNDLPNSEREVQAAVSTFPQAMVLRHHQATVDQVRSQLSSATIAHFSCHGTANLTEPLASELRMSDGLLTLKDIFTLNLADTTQGNYGLRLAILSACETGIIGLENADEAISLPTGLLQAGVAAVIASLWSVSDRSTMLLLTKFYDLWRKDGLPPDQALRQAQIWLRDSTAGEIAAYGGFFTPNPSDRLYAHPFHWAAFNYTGV